MSELLPKVQAGVANLSLSSLLLDRLASPVYNVISCPCRTMEVESKAMLLAPNNPFCLSSDVFYKAFSFSHLYHRGSN